MALSEALRDVGLDRYDINARLRPALLALLPAVLVILLWYPTAWTFFSGSLALISACGTTYFLAQIARRRGRLVERRLGDAVGRAQSAKLLTHSDQTITPETKGRYHAYLRSKGLLISSRDEEQTDPVLALSRTRSAVDWLLRHTRPKAKETLLIDENIAYGFYRNLYGLKPIAVAIVLLAALMNAALIILRSPDDPLFWSAVCLEILLVVIAAAWLAFVTKEYVGDASFAYAQRLFDQCEVD